MERLKCNLPFKLFQENVDVQISFLIKQRYLKMKQNFLSQKCIRLTKNTIKIHIVNLDF